MNFQINSSLCWGEGWTQAGFGQESFARQASCQGLKTEETRTKEALTGLGSVLPVLPRPANPIRGESSCPGGGIRLRETRLPGAFWSSLTS